MHSQALLIDLHMTLGIEVHALMAHTAPSTTPWHLKAHHRHTIEGFLKVDKGKVEQFVGGDVLQLVNNDGVSGTPTRHKTALHRIDVHHLIDVKVQHPFQQLHDLICELETVMVAAVMAPTFVPVDIQDKTLRPLYWDLTTPKNNLHQLSCQFNSFFISSFQHLLGSWRDLMELITWPFNWCLHLVFVSQCKLIGIIACKILIINDVLVYVVGLAIQKTPSQFVVTVVNSSFSTSDIVRQKTFL